MAISNTTTSQSTHEQGRRLADAVRTEFCSQIEQITEEHGQLTAMKWVMYGRGAEMLKLFAKLNRQFPQTGGEA